MTEKDNNPEEKFANSEDDNTSHEEMEGHLIEEFEDGGTSSGRKRKRRKIKVRKRVKIKRKNTPQKKAKKLVKTVTWILIVAAFLITLVILVLQLDFNSRTRKRNSVSYAPVKIENMNNLIFYSDKRLCFKKDDFSNFDDTIS